MFAVRFLCFATFLFVVLLSSGLLQDASAAGVNWAIAPDVAKKPAKLEISPLDRGSVNDIWARVLASSFNIKTSFVTSLYDRGYDYGDVALMVEIAATAKKDPADIAVLKRRGLGWGAIAKQLGVRPPALEKAKGKDSLFRRYLLAQCLAAYYGIPGGDGLALLNEKGYDFDEITMAVNVSALSGAPLQEVISARSGGSQWRAVAERFKLDPAKAGKPPAASAAGKEQGKDPVTPEGKVTKKKGKTADCSATCTRKCF